jgi:hypothetical protein
MNKTQTIILTVVLLAASFGCNKPLGVRVVYRIWINNQSNSNIAIKASKVYPDTTITFDQTNLRGCLIGDSIPLEGYDSWDELFNGIPSDTLSIFIFSSDTIVKYGWEYVMNNYLILERSDLSYADLESMNWKYSYPQNIVAD